MVLKSPTTSCNVLLNLTGEYVLATEYFQRSLEAVEVVYGEDSKELAQELHKLAQLLFNYPDCFCTDAVVHFL